MLGAVASAAPSIIGAIGGFNDAKKARRAHDRARERGDYILGVWDPTDPNRGGGEMARLKERGGLFGIRREYMQKLMENAQKGFKGARKDVRRGARSARDAVRTSGVQNAAETQRMLQERGLTGSTIGQQAQAGIKYQEGRALAEIDAQLGSLMGDIDMQQSAVMDALLRGNLGLEEANAKEMMAYVVANTGHGAGDTSMFFNQAPTTHAQTQQAFDPFSAGAGIEAGIDLLKGLF